VFVCGWVGVGVGVRVRVCVCVCVCTCASTIYRTHGMHASIGVACMGVHGGVHDAWRALTPCTASIRQMRPPVGLIIQHASEGTSTQACCCWACAWGVRYTASGFVDGARSTTPHSRLPSSIGLVTRE
jgi:hypothetical protein